MITKSELQEVHEQILSARRGSVAPPTDAELFAFMNGALSAEEQARVRESLVAYPELARAMAEPFPEQDAKPGDDAYLSDVQVEAQWKAFLERIQDCSRARVRTWRRASAALAAMLVVTIAGLAWQSLRVRQMALAPHVYIDGQQLMPDGERGPARKSIEVTPRGDSFALLVPLIDPPPFSAYRVAIAPEKGQPVWTSEAMPRPAHDNFNVVIPAQSLAPGNYQVIVYGVSGARQEAFATYRFSVTENAK